MKKLVLKLALSVMWLIGATLWRNAAMGPEAGTITGQMFANGSVILYIVAFALLFDAAKFFKSYVEWKVAGF